MYDNESINYISLVSPELEDLTVFPPCFPQSKTGNISDVIEDVYVVNVAGVEYFVDLPNVQWSFIKNDRVIYHVYL